VATSYRSISAKRLLTGRPAFADENCSVFRTADLQLEHVSAILADAGLCTASGYGSLGPWSDASRSVSLTG
jgi:hypothetical protein